MAINLGKFDNGQYYDEAAKRAYVPIYGQGGYSGMDNYSPGEITGYRGYNYAPGMYSNPAQLNGQSYDMLDTNGNKTGEGKWEGLSRSPLALQIAAILAAPVAMNALAGAGAAGAGAASGAGATSGMGVLANGAPYFGVLDTTVPGFWGAAGGGALGGAAGASAGGGGGAGAGGAGVTGFGDAGTMYAGADSAAAGSLGGGASMGGAAGSGSILGSLGGAKSLLGPAATLLGAVAGAKGQNASQTTSRQMDPRLDPFVFGDLLPRVQGLLAEQSSPERKAMNDSIRKTGMGLLNAPTMGNMFDKFYPGAR